MLSVCALASTVVGNAVRTNHNNASTCVDSYTSLVRLREGHSREAEGVVLLLLHFFKIDLECGRGSLVLLALILN